MNVEPREPGSPVPSSSGVPAAFINANDGLIPVARSTLNFNPSPSTSRIATISPPVGSQPYRGLVSEVSPEPQVDESTVTKQALVHIGIDFGTSCSSASFAWKNPNSHHMGAPEQITFSGHRTNFPTEVGITKDGTVVFGPDVQEHIETEDLQPDCVFRLPKLALADPTEARFCRDSRVLRDLHAEHQSALDAVFRLPLISRRFTVQPLEGKSRECTISNMDDVIVEFLRHLWDRVKQYIVFRSEKRTPTDAALFFKNRAVVSVAVPAIWTDPMIDRIRLLIDRAGIPNVHISSEPKCCAAWVAYLKVLEQAGRLPSSSASSPLDDLEGACSTLLDVGCGTADLSTYRLLRVGQAFRTESVLMGRGSLCGSLRLNLIFKSKMQRIMADAIPAICSRLNITKSALLDELVKSFEHKKKEFEGVGTKTLKLSTNNLHNMPLMRSDLYRVHSQIVEISGSVVREVFDDYFALLHPLVDQQLQAIAKREDLRVMQQKLVLVGGTNSNVYLIKKFNERYEGSTAWADTTKDIFQLDPIRVIAAQTSDMSLVAQGAVPITLNHNSPGERYVRTSYGLKWNLEYDPSIGHEKKDRKRTWLCDYKYEVRDRIKWMIKVGEIIGEKETVTHQGVFHIEDDGSDSITIKQTIYKSDSPTLGVRDGIKAGRGNQIFEAGELSVTIHRSCCKFPTWLDPSNNKGIHYIQTDFRTMIRYNGMEMKWYLVIPPSGSFPASEDLINHGKDAIIEETPLLLALRHRDHDNEDRPRKRRRVGDAGDDE